MLAFWGTRLLVRMLSSTQSAVELDPRLDWTVAAFTALAVLFTTLAFGLLPALRASSIAPNSMLKKNARGSTAGGGWGGARRHFTLARMMIALQLGLALTLLSAATLFGESFRRLLNVDGGFDARNVILIGAALPIGTPLDRTRQVLDEGLARLRRIPDVVAASRSNRTPLAGGWWQWSLFSEDPQAKSARYSFYLNCISPGYFETLGAKLIAGRDFDIRDSIASEHVLILDEAAARMAWGAADPVGRTITMRAPDMSGKKLSARVIGVVKNMKYSSLDEEAHPSAFVPLSQVGFPSTGTTFEIRLGVSGQSSRALLLARTALLETDKTLSIHFQPLDAQVSDTLIQPRLLAAVAGFFGVVALILAATGLYGIVAYSTARRKSEIGLRMALGATSQNVLWLVLSGNAFTVLLGSAVGLTASHFCGKLVKSLVFGVQPADPAVLGSSVALLAITATIAAYVPARRAGRLDPMESLRIE